MQNKLYTQLVELNIGGVTECVRQCFSTFSVKRNPLQQFLLLTEPM